MTGQKISDTLFQYIDTETISVENIRISLRCNLCGHQWGARIVDIDNLLPEAQKFICFPCYQKKLQEKSVRSVQYDYKHSPG